MRRGSVRPNDSHTTSQTLVRFAARLAARSEERTLTTAQPQLAKHVSPSDEVTRTNRSERFNQRFFLARCQADRLVHRRCEYGHRVPFLELTLGQRNLTVLDFPGDKLHR